MEGLHPNVPIEVDLHDSCTLAIRWMIDASGKENERTMVERVAMS